jgi:hypothetical protein
MSIRVSVFIESGIEQLIMRQRIMRQSTIRTQTL